MPPSVFGKPTFRDIDGTKDIFRTYDGRQATIEKEIEAKATIDHAENNFSALVDEVLAETANEDLNPLDNNNDEVDVD